MLERHVLDHDFLCEFTKMTSITDLVRSVVSSTYNSNVGIKVGNPAATLHVGGDAIVEEQLRVKNYVSSSGLRVSTYAAGPFTSTPCVSRFADVDETRMSLEHSCNLANWCSNAVGDLAARQGQVRIPDMSQYVKKEDVDALVKGLVKDIMAEQANDFITIEEADDRYVHEAALKCYPTVAQVHGAFVKKPALSNYVTHEELAKVGLDLRRCA